MKRMISMVLPLVLLFGGCASSASETISQVQETSQAESSNTADQSGKAHPISGGKTEEGKENGDPAADSSGVSFQPGNYVNRSFEASAGYEPEITFEETGIFFMRENLFEGMGQYVGQYTVSDGMVICNVDTIGFSGFAGDNVKQFRFQITEDALILADDLCASGKGHRSERTGSPYTLAPKQEVGEITETRLYISSNKSFEGKYSPMLELDPDRTFILTENLYSGMGHYYGTYEVDEYVLTLHVSKTDFSGFAGDDVKEIRFEALSEDVFQLMTDLCGSRQFDWWYQDIPQ